MAQSSHMLQLCISRTPKKHFISPTLVCFSALFHVFLHHLVVIIFFVCITLLHWCGVWAGVPLPPPMWVRMLCSGFHDFMPGALQGPQISFVMTNSLFLFIQLLSASGSTTLYHTSYVYSALAPCHLSALYLFVSLLLGSEMTIFQQD